MFSGLHRKVGIVFTLSKTIISDFWTQSALTHTALLRPKNICVCQFCARSPPGPVSSVTTVNTLGGFLHEGPVLSVGKLLGQEEALDRVSQVLARHYTHLTQRCRVVQYGIV